MESRLKADSLIRDDDTLIANQAIILSSLNPFILSRTTQYAPRHLSHYTPLNVGFRFSLNA